MFSYHEWYEMVTANYYSRIYKFDMIKVLSEIYLSSSNDEYKYLVQSKWYVLDCLLNISQASVCIQDYT